MIDRISRRDAFRLGANWAAMAACSRCAPGFAQRKSKTGQRASPRRSPSTTYRTFTILPTPQSIKLSPGSAAVGRESKVVLGGGLPADLKDELARALAPGEGVPIELKADADIAPEGYNLLVSSDGIRIGASGRGGFVYAFQRLAQITRQGRAPVAEIRDFPSLAMRGFQVNLNALRHAGLKEAVAILDSMAIWRLNTVLLEYGSRYAYGKHKAISTSDALTRDELQALLAHARALGIEPIPLHQCLGHVDYILRCKEYAHLSEEAERRSQWCPSKPESFDLFRELIDDVVATHRGIRYLHIGGDEARQLGKCPVCAKVAAEHGPQRLYIEFVTKAIEYVKSLGLIPIIWDDMLCRYSDVLDDLPREAIIMYWEYWTTRHPSAVFVARPDGKGVVVDRRWKGEWASELDSVERRMIDRFAAPIDFERNLSRSFLAKFGSWLGPEFPKRVRAFPYLEYYQKLGFKVIGAPAGGANHSTWRGLPDMPRYADNIFAFSRRIHEAKSLGIVTTSWYDFPIEGVTPSIMYTGQATWNVETAFG